MKRQITCKCGWEGPDKFEVGLCGSCFSIEQRVVGKRVGWSLVTGEWLNLRKGDVVKLIETNTSSKTRYGFVEGNSYTVGETPYGRYGMGPVNRRGAILTENTVNMVFEFEYVANEAPPMPEVKPPKQDSGNFTLKDRMEQIAELCKATQAAILIYHNGEQILYQVNRSDELQTEVATFDEVIEILKIIDEANARLSKWEWI